MILATFYYIECSYFSSISSTTDIKLSHVHFSTNFNVESVVFTMTNKGSSKYKYEKPQNYCEIYAIIHWIGRRYWKMKKALDFQILCHEKFALSLFNIFHLKSMYTLCLFNTRRSSSSDQVYQKIFSNIFFNFKIIVFIWKKWDNWKRNNE